MAKFAPVCPAHIAKGLEEDRALGNYHLLLAHDILKHPEEYRKLFNSMNGVKILDNSVIELGAAVDIKVIAEAAAVVCANVIVLPDILLDGKQTVIDCKKAYVEWRPILDKALGSSNWSYMIVPQGKTRAEFAECAEAFADLAYIGWWGIPRNYNIHGLGSRRDAIDICTAIDPQNEIHLLGFSDDIVDDVLSACKDEVSGIDSAVPIRAASAGMRMSMNLPELGKRGDWWDDPKTTYDQQMATNCSLIRNWIA